MSGKKENSNSNIVHRDELDWREVSHGDKFHLFGKSFTLPSGAQELGCGILRLPPGKRAFPEHYHMANEEAIYILKGEGTHLCGGKEQIVREGTFISLPRGEEHSHQMYNHTDRDLEYLCFSTMKEPEVVLYPNTGKMAVLAGQAPGGDPAKAALRKFFYPQEAGYFDGED
ncbi:cupin domain-containing protein [Emcibacter sp.]|uniref:cupin domain-containing protein n=1 Tax=Emcibacter sp. TaxID=1979954 RepID=UPI002AA93201|nr:cupin domain-containing protein [Emcibacter sp.]